VGIAEDSVRLENLTVTLVGPEFPINVGYAARLIKNFGVRKLYLIEPNFDRRVASVYAAHGADVLEDAEELDFGVLRARHDLLVGTTAVTAVRRANVDRLGIAPEEVAGYVSSTKSASLVFGRDTTGLRNDELARCDVVTSIGTGTSYKTLNVSHSMGILLYVLSKSGMERRRLPDLGERDAFASYAYELAVVTGMEKQRAERLRKLARRVTLRSQLDEKEMRLLISLMRRANNAILERGNQTRSKT
jgi:TrmH family RNA methyltransferase